MRESVEHSITLDDSIAESVKQAKQELWIIARTHELLCIDAATYDYCPKKAREQATLETAGVVTK